MSKGVWNAISSIVKGRVILRDVAEKAGVHLTTAARAMKNDPRVRPETLELIQGLAKKMGYEVDPMLTALSAYRSTKRPAQYHGTVGWITNYPAREGWRRHEAFRLYREGAAQALARQGYRLEDFWLQEPGLTARRASQILHSRGIRGLLLCPLPVSYGHLSLQWERFAAVTFGYTLLRPELHSVTAAHYHSMQVCVRKLHQLGCRRIGLVAPQWIDDRMHRMWSAAYQTQLPKPKKAGEKPLPTLSLGESVEYDDVSQRKLFSKWVHAHRPDAVIAFWGSFCGWLKEGGLRVPGEVSFVSPILQESERDYAGVVEPSQEIGAAAADFLVGMLHRGDYGLPRMPQQILLKGKWNPGKTAGRRAPATR